MHAVRRLTRVAIVVLIGAGTTVWYACSDHGADSPTGPAAPAPLEIRRGPPPDLHAAIAVQQRHTHTLLETPGVVGTAVTLAADGRPGVLLLLERPGIPGLPAVLDGVPVSQRVTGRLMAFSDPTTRQRPAPAGFSVGHPAITAGTIGARVVDATGQVYILSNNHVLANSNNANIGDATLQPGPFDGGTAADQIGTLADFQTITFSSFANNTIDAGIALSSTALLDNATPSDDAYGIPNATIYGDANGDGVFDDPNALLGLTVQKYGRTTHLTHGQITGVNATVMICYEVSGLSCIKSARFVDQLIITPNGFSGGGDSGSLIVTDDANLNPVSLLFAGSSTTTIGNRIDLVLNRFGVAIDGFSPPPPGPLTDLAVTGVNVAGVVVQNGATSVTVTVKNVGNQDVTSGFDITLRDTTENVTVGTETVTGLAPGAYASATFQWTPASAGDHGLVGSQSFADDRPVNDQNGATVTVNPQVTDVAVTAVTVPGAVSEGHVVNVGVTVKNIGNQDVAGSFDVTLEDVTAGVTLGTQTVGGLAAGSSATRTFTWNTTGAGLGGHTIVATHNLTDDNAANNQLSVVSTVVPPPTDLAVTGITGPRNVNQGDTAHIGVTVRNVGEQNVTTNFNVVLTDGTAGGITLGTQTVNGLAVGDSVTLDFPWNTAGAAISGHILFATQQLADANSANNSLGIAVTVNPPPTTDVAVTGVTAPASVTQGSTVAIGVTVQNVGGQDVTAGFDVVLTDATAGVQLGAQTVGTLAAGTSTTRSFSWTTTSATLGGHTLVATHTLADENAANDQDSATVSVTAPVIDVAVTGVNAPASVIQGNTATIDVTVQNVGGQDVAASFDVVLTDSTAGITLGTQTVGGLAPGASAIRTFTWNTSSALVGGHTLVASHTLTDDNAANNQASTPVSVTAQPTDIALTNLTGPASVTQGDTALVVVTVQNVGGQDVTTTFAIELTDGTAGGIVLDTQTVAGLAVGASATRTFHWNTAGATTDGHILIATQLLADNDATNNARAIGITVNPPPSTDVAVTAVNAPAMVTQGNTATIGVTVQNVGGQNVTAGFDVVLTDATAGVTLDTQTVAGLAIGASSTLSFTWNTTGAAPGGHTIVATQGLADDNAANDQGSAVVSVTAPVTDVAVTGVNAPASVAQGNTATIGVTVQNVGGLNVAASFDVVLTDATAGVTIGTQTVAGLSVGALSTLSFSWNTAGAALGGHTLVATHSLADDNPANNQGSATVSVTPQPTDLAVTALSGPATVTLGDVASVVVTVENVGGQDVTTGFAVVLTDGTAGGVTVDTTTIAGLAVGASATHTFHWNTAGAATGGHILIATQQLADNTASNNARAIGITVSAPSVHVGDLEGTSQRHGSTWSATVAITVHGATHAPLDGVTVSGSWNGSGTQLGECITGGVGGAGTCQVVLSGIPNSTKQVSFGVSALALSGSVYQPAANHDADGDSNGYSIFVSR